MGSEQVQGKDKASSKRTFTKLSGGLILASGISFVLLNTVSEALYPNYNMRTNALSDLGAVGSPTRVLWDGQLFISGVLGFLGMFFLFYGGVQSYVNLGKRRKQLGIIYLLPTVGAITVSLFPENYLGGGVHLIGAFITFLFGGISMIYSYRFTTTPLNYFSVVLGIISLAFTPFLGVAPSIGFGLVERLVLYPYIVWNIVFAGFLISASTLRRTST